MNKRRRFKAKRKRATRRMFRNFLSLCPRRLRGRIDDGEADFFERVVVPQILSFEQRMTEALGIPPHLMVDRSGH